MRFVSFRWILSFLITAAVALAAIAESRPAPLSPPPVPASRGAVALGQAERMALEDLAQRAEDDLRHNILPFWLENARDREHGGFYGRIDNDLKVRKGEPRGALLAARILWAFSAAQRRYRDPEYLRMARWAFDDLQRNFWDDKHGGVVWTVKPNGKPAEARKQVYAQSFALYAYAEYHRATGDKAALDRAIAIYRLLEAHAYDREQGGYFEAFAPDWRALEDGTRSLMGTEGAKSQNTMLHIMEAYTNLYRVWPDDGLRRRLSELVDRMVTRVLDSRTRHLHLLLAADWAPRSDGVSFGHDIEFSWLLTEAVEVLGDPALVERMRTLTLEIAAVTQAEAFDSDGGMYNEAGPNGVTDAAKHWWPQAESVVGFLNAYQLSGDSGYLRTARRSWDFIERRIIDRKDGEWFWGRDPKGRVLERQPKAGIWKCPYHNSRACLEIVARAEKLLGRPAKGR